jgi:hypothetical protein
MDMVLDEDLYKLYLARIDNLIGDNDSYLKQIEEFKTKR